MPVAALTIAPDHPVFLGHFPGRPIVPGVMLLDGVQGIIEAHTGLRLQALTEAKFHHTATPDDALQVSFEMGATSVRFEVLSAGAKIASGRFPLPSSATA